VRPRWRLGRPCRSGARSRLTTGAIAVAIIGVVERAGAEVFGAKRPAHDDEGAALRRFLGDFLQDGAKRGADNALVRPGGSHHLSNGTIDAVAGQELCHDGIERLNRQMQHQRGAGGTKSGKRLAQRPGPGAARGAREHDGLRDFRQSNLAAKRSGSCGEGGNARRQGIGNVPPIELAKLLADGTENREVAGVQPRHVFSGHMRRFELGNDLLETQRRGIDDTSTVRAESEEIRMHERAGIEADRAARQNFAASNCNEIGRAGAGADEMHNHGFTALHCVKVVAGRKACLLPTASSRSTESRVSVPPNLACPTSTAFSVSSVMALTTRRPPDFSASKLFSITVSSQPPPMNTASGGGNEASASGAASVKI